MLLRAGQGQAFWFDAGALCLEFLLSGGGKWGALFEQLHQPDDLAGWVTHSRFVPDGVTLDPAQIKIDAHDLTAAKRLRQALWGSATLLAACERAQAADLAVINEAGLDPPPALRIDEVTGTSRAFVTPMSGAQITSAIARDAITVFGGPLAARVRECASPACSLVFLDTSRPGTRRWCSMQRCGNREKARSFRDRRH